MHWSTDLSGAYAGSGASWKPKVAGGHGVGIALPSGQYMLSSQG